MLLEDNQIYFRDHQIKTNQKRHAVCLHILNYYYLITSLKFEVETYDTEP